MTGLEAGRGHKGRNEAPLDSKPVRKQALLQQSRRGGTSHLSDPDMWDHGSPELLQTCITAVPSVCDDWKVIQLLQGQRTRIEASCMSMI